jgi:hypothetical protein
MCIHCRLAIPLGPHEACHSCAIALRAELRRGLRTIEEYLDLRLRLETWLTDEWLAHDWPAEA